MILPRATPWRLRRNAAARCASILLMFATVVAAQCGNAVTSVAQTTDRPPVGPLVARGFVDAPGASVVVSASVGVAGDVVAELPIDEGQSVKAGDIVAVMSGHGANENAVRIAEVEHAMASARLKQLQSGARSMEIAVQRVAVDIAIANARLAELEAARSARAPDIKQAEKDVAALTIERERQRLQAMTAALEQDRSGAASDLAITTARLELARLHREAAVIRSPIDGVVLQVFVRRGERVHGAGILRIVDFSRLRIVADVDEIHLSWVKVGAKVDATFRGLTAVYPGRVTRIVPAVQRMRRADPDGASTGDGRIVQVEISLEHPGDIPQIMGREARVTFR